MATQFDHSKLSLAWVSNDETVYVVGESGVVDIKEHSAKGEGDRWFYDVHYESGKVIRVFDPKQVCFSPDIPESDIPF